jgi:putative DNA primase/helicase
MNCILSNTQIVSQDNEEVSGTLQRIEEINQITEVENLPEGFEVDEEGVWYIQQGKKEADPPTRTFISSPLKVTACTRDHASENHGRILEFTDIDENEHVWTMPMELLAGDSSKILSVLLNMGLRISPSKRAKDHLLEYITLCQPIRRARCVLQTGWFGNVFVLPSETIGAIQNEKIIYQSPTLIESFAGASGTLGDWREKVATKAIGNSRLVLAISASFAGPLLHLMNHENIGIHFRGNSSLGKSTAGIVANSVWGGKEDVQAFRATSNGLEGVASLYNDRLLCLDELGQLSTYDAGEVFYMLGNGVGKSRANRQGLPRRSAKWRLVFLSNGELSLAQLLEEGGKRIRAGQEVRLIEIPSDTGAYGLFENLHEFENGSAFSDHLRDSCSKFYGTASREFLRRLLEDPEGSIGHVQAVIEGAKQRYLPKDASGQVIRVFNNFALIAAVGELASSFGVTGWAIEESLNGVMKCFKDWLEMRGNGMQEEHQVLSQVKKFFENNGESRFSPWNEDPISGGRTINRAGFRKQTDQGEVEFYVYPNTFRKEVCSGIDYRYAEKICIKHGLLFLGPQNSPTRSERLPGSANTTRCYRFTSSVLSG